MSFDSRAALTLVAALIVSGCAAEKRADRPPVGTTPSAIAPPAEPAATPGDSSGTAPQVVGGACEYSKFPGTCTVTATGEPATFRYEGTVAGKNVTLEGNEVDRTGGTSFAKVDVGASQPCTLEFITKGTCTPCLLSVGSCGQAAWDLFRARGATN